MRAPPVPPESSSKSAPAGDGDRAIAIYSWIFAALLAALNALSPFLPHDARTWGIVHPQTLVPGLHIGIALAAPLLLFALWERRLRQPPPRSEPSILAAAWPWMALLLILHVVIPNTIPYGDAVRFYRYIPGSNAPEPNAPLSFEVHRVLATLLPDHLVGAFSALSALGGALCVPALFRLARALFPAPHDSQRRSVFLLGMAGSGVWQLFAGYVEHYHVQLALIAWALALLIEGERGERGARGAGWGALLLGAAVAWNLSAAWLLPAVFVPRAFWRGRAAAPRLLAIALVPLITTLAPMCLRYGATTVAQSYAQGFHPAAMPSGGFVPGSEWLSPSHLAFVANNLILSAPLVLILAPALVARRALAPARSWLGAVASVRGAMLIAALLFTFLWHPRLGWSRDWDLFAWAHFLLQAIVLETTLRAEARPATIRAWLPAIAAAQAHALLFLLSNSRFGAPR